MATVPKDHLSLQRSSDLILKVLDLHVRASSKEVQIETALLLVDNESDTDLVTIVQT